MPLLTALAVLMMGFAPWTWLSGPTSIVPAPRLQVATAQVDAATTVDPAVDPATDAGASPAGTAVVANAPDPGPAPLATPERSNGGVPRSVAGPRAPPPHS